MIFLLENVGNGSKKRLNDIDTVLRSYIQGQLLISFLLAILLFTGYLIIGLEYALLLAIFGFFMNLIPFIGPWISVCAGYHYWLHARSEHWLFG